MKLLDVDTNGSEKIEKSSCNVTVFPKMTYSDPRATYSDPNVTHSDPTSLPLPPLAPPDPKLAIS